MIQTVFKLKTGEEKYLFAGKQKFLLDKKLKLKKFLLDVLQTVAIQGEVPTRMDPSNYFFSF